MVARIPSCLLNTNAHYQAQLHNMCSHTETDTHTQNAPSPTHTTPGRQFPPPTSNTHTDTKQTNGKTALPNRLRFTFGSRCVMLCGSHYAELTVEILTTIKSTTSFLILILLLLLCYPLVLCAIKFSFSHPLIFLSLFFTLHLPPRSTHAKHKPTTHRRHNHTGRRNTHNARTTRRIHTPPSP